ncbi:MAG: GvpL/GvpF family gas vesicle protein [Scytolyngbya sp. HA4215-MV1]|jgi:hypothetical protein|nr:GvpL/GvpF family gas vesicle protein [Scytolyngbya sp. HA4215-MV1]
MYIYAFCKTPDASLAMPKGISGSVQLVGNDQVSALVEPEIDLEKIQSQDEQLLQAVLAHDRTTRELFEQTTILPLRFGTFFLSEERLQEHLETQKVDYLTKLNWLQDKAEYTLKLAPADLSESPIAPEITGKQYFLAKKQQYQAQLARQQQQQAEWVALVQTIALSYPNPFISESQEDAPHRIYLLVSRQEEAILMHHLQTWQNQCAYWQLQLGEALPPYHFV